MNFGSQTHKLNDCGNLLSFKSQIIHGDAVQEINYSNVYLQFKYWHKINEHVIYSHNLNMIAQPQNDNLIRK